MEPQLLEALRQFDTGGDPAQLDLIYELLKQRDESDRLPFRNLIARPPAQTAHPRIPEEGYGPTPGSQDKLLPTGQIPGPPIPSPAAGGGLPGGDKLMPVVPTGARTNPLPFPERLQDATSSPEILQDILRLDQDEPGPAPDDFSFDRKEPRFAAGMTGPYADKVAALDPGPPPAPPAARDLELHERLPLPAAGRVRPEGVGPETLQDILSLDAANMPHVRSEIRRYEGDKAEKEFAHLTDPLTQEEIAAGKRRAMTGQGGFGDTKTPRFAADMQRGWNKINGAIADIKRSGGVVPKELLDERSRYESFLKENPETQAFMESGGTQGEIASIGAKARRGGKSLYEALGDPAVRAARDRVMKDGDDWRYRPGSDDGYNPETGVRVDLSTKRGIPFAQTQRARLSLEAARRRLEDEGSTPEKRAAKRRDTQTFRSVTGDAERLGSDIASDGDPLPEGDSELRKALGLSKKEWKALPAMRQRALRRKVRSGYRKGKQKSSATLNRERKEFHSRGRTHPQDRPQVPPIPPSQPAATPAATATTPLEQLPGETDEAFEARRARASGQSGGTQ